jgi:hypothetical protein
LNQLENREIEFELDIVPCSSTLKRSSFGVDVDKSSVATTTFTYTLPTRKQNVFTNDTDLSFTISSSDIKENKPFKIEIIIGGCFIVLLLIFLVSVSLIYFVNKKVKISRTLSNLPRGSQLDMLNPPDSIEMNSIDSFDFQASNENIYEIPNPLYSNV